MQKNWYIIYTKPKCEKKVASLLTKKKIENFFPLHQRETTSFGKRKVYQEPLFTSYVFAHIEDCEIEKTKAIRGVVNLLYWKGKAAIINNAEIEAMKEFTSNFQNIHVEKAVVQEKKVTQIIDNSKYSFTGNVLIIKNTMAKVNLPSLGFTLIAKIESTDSMHPDSYFTEKKLLMES